MKLDIYQVDAFARKVFKGNPAAVCPLEQWLPEEVMQNVAMENNLSETAFFIPDDKRFHLRWFTPSVEVNLCGHATLATAHVMFNDLGYQSDTIHFDTKGGSLSVTKKDDMLVMNFPSNPAEPADLPEILTEALGLSPEECYKGDDYLLILDSEQDVRGLEPDFLKLREVDSRGVIVSAPGDKVDFVSRFFAPAVGIDEDPVTGSAHTALTPYWSKRLGKDELVARQVSRRGGEIYCKALDSRVELGGYAASYLKGTVEIFS